MINFNFAIVWTHFVYDISNKRVGFLNFFSEMLQRQKEKYFVLFSPVFCFTWFLIIQFSFQEFFLPYACTM